MRCSSGGDGPVTFVLVPMHVAADGLAECVAALRHVRNFGGAIVSMPHKTAIVRLLDELTPEARLVGAVNVIQRRADGGLVGTILDGEGFVGGLAREGHRVAGAHCLLAGAGGAASAVAFALAKHGCASLCIVNRTRRRPMNWRARVRRAFPAVRVVTDATSLRRIDIAVNGTSLGMQPDDALPFPDSVIERSALVAECVIAPEMTRLLQSRAAARQRDSHRRADARSATRNDTALHGRRRLTRQSGCADRNRCHETHRPPADA